MLEGGTVKGMLEGGTVKGMGITPLWRLCFMSHREFPVESSARIDALYEARRSVTIAAKFRRLGDRENHAFYMKCAAFQRKRAVGASAELYRVCREYRQREDERRRLELQRELDSPLQEWERELLESWG